MTEKINDELVKLQNELSSLGSAVSKINEAEKIASEVVKSVQELQTKYKESFENIAKETKQFFTDNLNETKKNVAVAIADLKKQTEESKKSLTELQNNLNNSNSKTSVDLNTVIDSHSVQIQKVDALLKSYLDLANSTALLTNKIDKIDFSGNFDKIYANMTELNIEIRTVKEISIDNAKNDMLEVVHKRLIKNTKRTNAILYIAGFSLLFMLLAAFQFAAMKYFPEYDYLKEYIKSVK
jgi:DNA repair exonuclease SbcCD ATPase subunit